MLEYKITDQLTTDVCINFFRKEKQNANNKVIYYFCGYNDYFYHYHLPLTYSDYDFVVMDIESMGYNKSYCNELTGEVEYSAKKVNYIDDFDKIYEKLVISFNKLFDEEIRNGKIYNERYILAHSMGAVIAMSFLSRYENYENYEIYKNNECKMKFNKLMLNSPLLEIPIRNRLLYILFTFICKILLKFRFLFNLLKMFDLHTCNRKVKPQHVYYLIHMIALNNIYKTNNFEQYIPKELKNTNNFEHCIVNINPKYKSINHPKYMGTICSIYDELNRIKITKLNIQTNIVCSDKFGKMTYYKNDDTLNPDRIKSLHKDFFNNSVLKQYDTAHDCLITPHDSTHISYHDIMNFLIN